MSKKIIAFSLLSLCVLLCGCGVQNNTVIENECVDNTCGNEINKTAEARTTNKTTSEIESEIAGFDENSSEIQVAEKLDGEPIVVEGQSRDF